MKRMLVVALIIHLTLCNPVSALRQGQLEIPQQRSGLEEALGIGPKTLAAISSRIRRFIHLAGEGDPGARESILTGFSTFVGAPLPTATTEDGPQWGKQLADDLTLLEQTQPAASLETQMAIPTVASADKETAHPDDENLEQEDVGVASIEIYPDVTVDPAEVDRVMHGAGHTLTAEEEHSLFTALHARNLGDAKRLELYQFLIQVNMPYVLDWLRRKGYTRHFSRADGDDLIQVGNQGLIRAVILFNPRQGTRFTTYADYQIKAYVGHYLSQQHGLNRIPQYRITDYRKAMRKLQPQLNREPTAEELAAELGWDTSEIAKFRQFGSTTSIFFGEDAEEMPLKAPPEEAAPAFDANLAQLLSVLTDRQRVILKMGFGIGTQGEISYTQEGICKRFGYTRQRIQQIKREALEKLREAALEPPATEEKQDDHADVYLFEKLGIPPGHPLFRPLLRLGRANLERIDRLLPSEVQSFPVEPVEGETFAGRIRRLRNTLGLLQKQVATGISVSEKTYRLWEAETHPPRFSHLRSLADYYVQQQSLPAEETYRFLGQKDPRILLQELHDQPLPEVLRALRTSCWLNQPEAAQAIGVNYRAYRDWETGSRHPRLFSIRKIASYYISQYGFSYNTTHKQLGIQSPRKVLQGLIGKPLPIVLRDLRNSIPISQRTVALKTGASKKDVWGWESGRHVPKTEKLQKLVGLYAEEQHLPREFLLKAFGFKTNAELLAELQEYSLPQILRKLREFAGESQEQVADRTGATRGAYGHWEQGYITRMPTSSRYLLAMHYALQYGFPLQHLIQLFKFRPSSEVMQEIAGKDLPHTLRILRNSQGLLQTEISRTLGVTPGTYQVWEAGRHLPFLTNLQKLASYYSQNHGFPLEALQQQLESKWRRERRKPGPKAHLENTEGQTGGLEEAVVSQQALGSYP